MFLSYTQDTFQNYISIVSSGQDFDPKYTTILCLTLILELKIASLKKETIQDPFVCGSVSARKNPHSPIYKESRSADFNCQNRVFYSKNVVVRGRKRIEESTKKNVKDIFLIQLLIHRFEMYSYSFHCIGRMYLAFTMYQNSNTQQ